MIRTHTITVHLLVTLLNVCQTLAGNTAQHSDLLCRVTGDTESLEKNYFPDPFSSQCEGSGSETRLVMAGDGDVTVVNYPVLCCNPARCKPVIPVLDLLL